MTTLDNLLEQAYDAEQAGDLIGAAALRAQARGQQPIEPQAHDVCRACHTAEHAPSAMQPAFCTECVYAMLQGRKNRLDTPAPVVPPPAAPAIQVEQWQSEKGTTYTDFTIGEGLTKVLIGSEGANKPGVELAIGRNCINTRLDEVLTLADVRRLRDNLTALLNDPRLGGEQAPTPAIRIEQLYYDQSKRGDLSEDAQSGPLAYVDYYAGVGDTEVAISFNVGGTHAPEVELIGRTGSLDSVLAMVANLHTLLADPRVQAAQAASEQASAPTMKKAA